ncbi:AMP-dependent synthetase/ligase [Gordonia humi]|uniref:AMP-dependent synthetase/ligase n=1 Tax=Gordonia humi TaxID=686429 RepID=UPI003623D83E
MLHDRAQHEPHTVAFNQWKDGVVQPTTWREYDERVTRVALGLNDLGVTPGDRVAIMCSARQEWVIAALAVLTVGGVLVGVYPTSSHHELEQVLGSSEATAIVAETAADLAKVSEVAPRLPHLRVAIGVDAVPSGPATMTAATWQTVIEAGTKLGQSAPDLHDELIRDGDIDQPAVLFSTSGSTGAPKYVVHTHRSLQYAVLSQAMTYPEMGRVQHDLVGFLGLSRRCAGAYGGVFAPVMTRLVITFCTMEERSEVLIAVRPTAVVWPPRMHEKLATEALQAIKNSHPAFRIGYSLAMRVARRTSALRWRGASVPIHLRAADDVCRKLIFLPLRAKVGMDRITVSWTASGSMTPEVAALWHTWGLDLRELYGTTETCGTVIAQWDRDYPAPGTIGKCLPDDRWAARVSPDGELELRAPCLFTEYWNNPEARADAFNDGWYRTGDLVEMAADGEVKIIGRVKDLIKTSGGKSVSPQPIEIRLKASPLIDEAIIVGEGRKYLTVLLAVSAEARGMEPGERDAVLRQWIDEVNSELARPLQLKDFRVLPRPLSADSGELTLKGTIRRANVLISFADVAQTMYSGDEHSEIARHTRFIRTGRG